MKKTKQMLLAATAGAALFTLTACGGGGGGGGAAADFSKDYSGTLSVWGFENADEVGTSRIDVADKTVGENDVTVELEGAAFDAQKFTTRAASGNIPDVVQMDRKFVTTYAAQGLVMPLDKCFALYDLDPQEYWYPQVVDDVTYDGSVYAVPQFYQPPAILLNTRVMDEAGVTVEDMDTSNPEAFLEAVKKMTVMDGQNPVRMGFDPQGPQKAGLWMLSFGGGTIDGDGKPTLDDENNVKAIEFLKEIYDAQGGYANAKSFVDSFDVFGDNNSYVADQVGAAVFDQWYVNVLTSYAEQVEIGATPVMTQDGQPFTVASGSSFVIPTSAKNPSAACAWLLSLTSAEAWQAAGEARNETTINDPGRHGINAGLFTGSPESDQAIREAYVKPSDFPGFDQTIAAYYDVAASGQSFGSSPAGQQIESELQNAVTSALLGEKSAADALKDAQAAAQRAYDQVAG
ncbi:extracellular solute-binding protein [Protaetiibacter sp. SSC-01]|uniref:ABC transporter substrate-binding protein n=1 Tax=Protaetiibacter sp. SSC-01 TaxID=2759943 RepID=UPI001656AD68|nr:extracellular solute-binding protein [Protaetiibacter sp. SSC-01]QNO37725.1 extracellular solute-binding protein [Protaetiibacter sp. SSC-01]